MQLLLPDGSVIIRTQKAAAASYPAKRAGDERPTRRKDARLMVVAVMLFHYSLCASCHLLCLLSVPMSFFIKGLFLCRK
jgi:hypothetical protein